MAGNVWEWVEDVYVNSYDGAPVDGSAREDGGALRAVRGAGWWDTPRNLRATDRGREDPGFRYIVLGFRPVRSVPRP